MCRISFLIILFIFTSELCQGQSTGQTIKGSVVDHFTHQPLVGASIQVVADDFSKVTATDSLGNFEMSQVPSGKYEMQVSFIGYQTKIDQVIEVESAKELVLTIGLYEDRKQLNEIVISASDKLNLLEPLSAYSYSIEKSERYAATFYDPARVATSFAGVATSFDQANNIIVRGNSPNTLSWRLEGLEIVNPNHLTNAGTFTDRASISGGGVSVLSAQILDNSDFYTGAYPAEFGNALAGVFDVKLKKGNFENHEHTVQAGLLGLDLGSEGPIGQSGNASYLANYRYSTIGLLSSLGLDVGDEAINFQDLSFNLSLKNTSLGSFNFYGIGGKSSERFQAARDSSVWEFAEDRYDVEFTSDMGVLGLKNQASLSKRTFITNSMAFSIIESSRDGDFVTDRYESLNLENDLIQKKILSFRSSINHKLGRANYLEGGFYFNRVFYEQFSNLNAIEDNITNELVSVDSEYTLLNGYFTYHTYLLENVYLNAGLHSMYLNFSDSYAVEPRASLNIGLSSNHQLKISYGLHSALQSANTYFAFLADDRLSGNPNTRLDFTRAHHYTLGHQMKLGRDLVLKSELYYQQLFDVPIAKNVQNAFSVLNIMEEFVDQELVNQGKGKNYGIEATLEKYMNQGYYFLANGSLYDSEYLASDGVWRDTRFNGNYLVNLTGGKQFIKQKSEFQRAFNINARMIYQGGFRQTPIQNNGVASLQNIVFSDQLSDYWRVDLQLSFKKNKPNYTRIVSLDIQNLLNRKNLAFYYFDQQQNQVVNKYQLGILPFLNYRVEF